MRVALFVTCLGDALAPRVAQATVALLERLGVTVEFPQAQTCCGQMHVNTGYVREARSLVSRHVDVFEPYDAIVAPSASCVGSVRHQHAVVARACGDDALATRAAAVGARTYELSELLVDVLGVVDVGATFAHRVTYHPTCHSLRLLRVDDRPLRLLRAVRGLELVELPAAEQCCGFGGTFSLKNADVSGAMLADKLDRVDESGADVVTALDTSCLLQLAGGLSRREVARGARPVRALHLAEILASTGER